MAKKYRVEITRTAESDITAISRFIARDDPAAASNWVEAIERQISTLERWPARCAIIPEAADLGMEYRHLVYRSYRTIFRIVGSRVIIIRVLHGAQLLALDVLR